MPVMFNLNTNNSSKVRSLFSVLIKIYGVYDVAQERKQYLNRIIAKFGYVPYPHFKALRELSEGETVYALLKILQMQGTAKADGTLINFSNPSVLSRRGIKNSNWFKKEGHNIKLISLSALGDGNNSEDTADFIQWIKELICIPKGNVEKGVLADTIYLLPFHPREFGCAYLPSSSDISPALYDKRIAKFLGLGVKEQVNLFITLAQLMGHPVIYDILPQTGRFSKIVLSNPYVARWANIKELMASYEKEVTRAAEEIKETGQIERGLVDFTLQKYIQNINGACVSYDENENAVVELFETYMKEIKRGFANKATLKASQEEYVKIVSKIIEKANGKKVRSEEDIHDHGKITNALIEAGFWPMPGGAWCSCGVPVFDRMAKNNAYPIYKHYDIEGKDVSKFANLDCQTPYYFTYLETGKLNDKVVDFYVKYVSKLQKEYNFDGFRIDHIDHVADKLSEKDGVPISYRIPKKVLGLVNSSLKRQVPYFATLAEYMLWDDLYIEYHKQMNFDLLWGNDIISQSSKTPKQIIADNKTLENYNIKEESASPLSILKTYNNQDGEFEAIDRYPGQLGIDGALFKWFKYKFTPGGKWANRPMLYVDGDESYTQRGIERVIGSEVSMIRGENLEFYEKFNALNFYAQNSDIINAGKAKLLSESENGLAVWEITSNFGDLIVISNYKSPSEKMEFRNENNEGWTEFVYGNPIYDSKISFEGKSLKTYFEFERDEDGNVEFVEKPLECPIKDEITMGELRPGDFKVYRIE